MAHLVASRLGTEPEVRFLGDLATSAFVVEPVAAADWLRIAELVARYRDRTRCPLPRPALDTVDASVDAASVVAAAERLGIRDVATFDRRHFTVGRCGSIPQV